MDAEVELQTVALSAWVHDGWSQAVGAGQAEVMPATVATAVEMYAGGWSGTVSATTFPLVEEFEPGAGSAPSRPKVIRATIHQTLPALTQRLVLEVSDDELVLRLLADLAWPRDERTLV